MSERPDHRGRVVMVVDNVIDGDSRVQKVARSAAEAGWHVTLIGRSPTGTREEYRLGDAEVIRVPVVYTLHGHRRRAPGRSLRWPLAYGSRDQLVFRGRTLDSRRRRVATELGALKVQARDGLPRPLALLRLATIRRRDLSHRVARLLHRLRAHEFSRAVNHRKAPHGVVDDLSARVVRAVGGRQSWRRLEPLLLDYELSYGPAVDALTPDLIHAHDFRMIGLAVSSARRLQGKGHATRVVYDAHEYLPGVRAHSLRWMLGNTAHELLYVPQADAVVTVSDRLAEMLQERHHLATRPTVVLNAPARSTRSGPDVRAACGLDAATPLLVYSGSGAPQRGLMTAVRALPLLPEAHLALVVAGSPAHVAELRAEADSLGVGSRLHFLDYVPQDEVVGFLQAADIGLIPIHHLPNHEIALITKYFEYAQGRLPIVSSDVETMAQVTRELGNGEVFTAEDPADLARAVRAVLADPARYRTAYDRPGLLESWSWEAQAATLDALYHRLVEGSTA